MARSDQRRGRISATHAARNFGRLVDRVREEQATYVVERGGLPVAHIGPPGPPRCTVGDLLALMRDRRRLGEEYASAVESALQRHNVPRVRRNPWLR